MVNKEEKVNLLETIPIIATAEVEKNEKNNKYDKAECNYHYTTNEIIQYIYGYKLKKFTNFYITFTIFDYILLIVTLILALISNLPQYTNGFVATILIIFFFSKSVNEYKNEKEIIKKDLFVKYNFQNCTIEKYKKTFETLETANIILTISYFTGGLVILITKILINIDSLGNSKEWLNCYSASVFMTVFIIFGLFHINYIFEYKRIIKIIKESNLKIINDEKENEKKINDEKVGNKNINNDDNKYGKKNETDVSIDDIKKIAEYALKKSKNDSVNIDINDTKTFKQEYNKKMKNEKKIGGRLKGIICLSVFICLAEVSFGYASLYYITLQDVRAKDYLNTISNYVLYFIAIGLLIGFILIPEALRFSLSILVTKFVNESKPLTSDKKKKYVENSLWISGAFLVISVILSSGFFIVSLVIFLLDIGNQNDNMNSLILYFIGSQINHFQNIIIKNYITGYNKNMDITSIKKLNFLLYLMGFTIFVVPVIGIPLSVLKCE